jgi:hypothetical protein
MTVVVQWLWVIVVVALIGFGVGSTPAADWPTVQVNGNEGVILPAAAAPDLLQGTGLAPEGYWLPRQGHLQAAEDALSDQWQGYRQYAGFVEDGERKVYINAFCDDMGIDWKRTVVFVMDGGACYWQAVYNVETGEVEWLTVNGEA